MAQIQFQKIFNTHVYENWTRLTNSARPEAHTKLNSLDSSVRPEIKIKDSNGKCLEMEKKLKKGKTINTKRYKMRVNARRQDCIWHPQTFVSVWWVLFCVCADCWCDTGLCRREKKMKQKRETTRRSFLPVTIKWGNFVWGWLWLSDVILAKGFLFALNFFFFSRTSDESSIIQFAKKYNGKWLKWFCFKLLLLIYIEKHFNKIPTVRGVRLWIQESNFEKVKKNCLAWACKIISLRRPKVIRITKWNISYITIIFSLNTSLHPLYGNNIS